MAALRGLPSPRGPSAFLLAGVALSLATADTVSIASDDARGACLLQTKHDKARSLLELSEQLMGGDSVAALLGRNASSFGPEDCVTLSETPDNTCKITTHCTGRDLSSTDFSFVCINPENSQPYTLHSYGKGGFDDEESFDTGIECHRCATLSGAFNFRDKTGEDSAGVKVPDATTKTTTTSSSQPVTAYFGPAGCFETYLSQAGTCVVRTRCLYADTAEFNPGVTCTDEVGGYTRYYMGVGSFDKEDIFDTTLHCEKCEGVDDNQGLEVTGILPKRMLEQLGIVTSAVINLTKQVKMLKSEVQNISKRINETNITIANGINSTTAKTASGTQSSPTDVSPSSQSVQSKPSDGTHDDKKKKEDATAGSQASGDGDAEKDSSANDGSKDNDAKDDAKDTDADDDAKGADEKDDAKDADAKDDAKGADEKDDEKDDAEDADAKDEAKSDDATEAAEGAADGEAALVMDGQTEGSHLVAMGTSPKKLRELLQHLAQ